MQELQIYMFITDSDECEPIDFRQKKYSSVIQNTVTGMHKLSAFAVRQVYLIAVQLGLHKYC